VLLYDRVRDGEAEPRSFADLLRREEGVEDPRLRIDGNARPVVYDLNERDVVFVIVTGSNDERPAAIAIEHGLLRIDHEVEEYLLDLVCVGKNARQVRPKISGHGQRRHPIVGAQRDCVADQPVEVNHRARGLPFSRERQEIPHDPRRTFRFSENHGYAAFDRVVERFL